MKPFSEMREDELAAALGPLRPVPSPSFAAELDQRAAAGFPRRSPQAGRNPFARFLAWLRDGSKWRLLIPAGGVAVVVIAAATVVVATKHDGFEPKQRFSVSESAPPGSGSEAGGPLHAWGGRAAQAEHHPSGRDSSMAQYQAEIPTAGVAASAGNAPTVAPHRDVERAAEIVIGTKPGEVGEASSKVFETAHAYDAIVLNSSTRDGSSTHAEANFELLIPSGKVGDAMAAFSRIGEVVNRHEATTDITAPTVGASEHLQDSEARIEGLLAQLSEATTESEREIVEAELHSERHHAAYLKSKLSNLKRRANLSRVSVRIVSGKGALTPGGSGSDGGWGVGSALGDAGHLLSVAAGVTIVGLAVLAPLLLLALLVWLAGHAWTRRARERALT